MKKVLLALLLCLALATPAFAWRIDAVKIANPSGEDILIRGVASGITSDRVFLSSALYDSASGTPYGKAKALGTSLNIYRVTLIPNHDNFHSSVLIGNSSLVGNTVAGNSYGYRLVSGTTITIDTDNLSDIYAIGFVTNDSVNFIAETR